MNPFSSFGAKSGPRKPKRKISRTQQLAMRHAKAKEEYQRRIVEAEEQRMALAMYVLKHGEKQIELYKFFDSMTKDDSKEALKRIKAPWIQELPKDRRVAILGRLDTAIIRIRKEMGLSEIDDPLPPIMAGHETTKTLFIRAQEELKT